MEETTLNITEYGYIPDGKPSQDGETPARVTAVYKDRYEIICSYGTGLAALKKSSYYTGEESFPTTGDFVLINWEPEGDSRIIRTLTRKTFLFPPGSLFGRPLGAAGSREL